MILNRNIFKEKREAKNLSVEDLAGELNIKVNELNKIENFEKEIDYKNLTKIKEILDIDDQEVKEYFDNYYRIKSRETKVLRRNLILNLSSFAYLLCFVPFIAMDWISKDNIKYLVTIIIVGFTFLVGSYTSFVSAKKFISKSKWNFNLIIFTVLFILCLATYVVLVVLICNYLRYTVHI